MPQFSEPFSVPDDLADGWDDMVRRNQALQAASDPEGQPAGPDDTASNGDDLPIADWMAQRTQQIADALNPPPETPADGSGRDSLAAGQGIGSLEGGVGDDVVRAAPAKPLTGRTPTASSVANAVDSVAAGPNTSAQVHNGYFDGMLQRGAGQDVHLHGDVHATGFSGKGVDVTGVLGPPDAAGGVTISNVKATGLPHHASLPPQLRLYNRLDGELDIDLGGPVKFGPIPVVPSGRHPIG